MKKITRATFKAFISKNAKKLWINQRSRFDPMEDGVRSCNQGFTRVEAPIDLENKNTFGISGLWLVGQSRDYFETYDKNNMTGIAVSNCCGSCIVAIEK